jgi:hypothetical protein
METMPPKLQFLQEPHGIRSQKTEFFIVTAVKSSHHNKINPSLKVSLYKSCGIKTYGKWRHGSTILGLDSTWVCQLNVPCHSNSPWGKNAQYMWNSLGGGYSPDSVEKRRTCTSWDRSRTLQFVIRRCTNRSALHVGLFASILRQQFCMLLLHIPLMLHDPPIAFPLHFSVRITKLCLKQVEGSRCRDWACPVDRWVRVRVPVRPRIFLPQQRPDPLLVVPNLLCYGLFPLDQSSGEWSSPLI